MFKLRRHRRPPKRDILRKMKGATKALTKEIIAGDEDAARAEVRSRSVKPPKPSTPPDLRIVSSRET